MFINNSIVDILSIPFEQMSAKNINNLALVREQILYYDSVHFGPTKYK